MLLVMDIELDRARLIKIRKSKKLTQAQVASKLGVSLRTYSDYENLSSGVLLSDREIFTLSRALNVVVSDLWAEVPRRVTVFYSQTTNHSVWAKFLADSKFIDLEVSGLPSRKALREPLMKLIEAFEAGDQKGSDKKLSSKIKRSFDCDDWVNDLIEKKNPTDVPPKLLVTRVPTLIVEKDGYLNPYNSEMVESYLYFWGSQWRAKIDFTDTDAETNPASIEYGFGDFHILFPSVEDYGDDGADERRAEEIAAALDTRPDIEFQDELDSENNQNLEKEKEKGQ
jgi:transcriptional regulator with XRE-family HTH domain